MWLFLLAVNNARQKEKRLWLKYLKSFLLRDMSEEGGKVLAEMLARKIERQCRYGWALTPTEVTAAHLGTASAGAQLSPPVHRQLLASLWET